MTDAELAAAAKAEYALTTDSHPTWVRKGKPASSHWEKGNRLLDRIIGAVPQPSWTRTVTVSTPSALTAALSDLRAGDRVVATGVFPGQVEVRKMLGLTVVAELDFTAARFPGPALVGLFIVGAGGIRVVDGEYTNPGGDGIRVENCPGPIEIVDPTVHNTGSQGILVQGNGGPNKSVSLIRPNVYATGDKTKDSHTPQGTGLHGIYFGGSTFPSSGEIVEALVTDIAFGSGMEFGANAVDLTVTLPEVRRITGAANGDAAGNAFNLWGSGNRNVLIYSPSGADISGSVCLVDALSVPSGSVTVLRATFDRVGRTPRYPTRNGSGAESGVSYVDCA